MRSLLFSIVLLFITSKSTSQAVIATTGGEGTIGNINVNYTVGEAVIATLTNDTSVLTQGFHQPTYIITSISETFLAGEIAVYPNPTNSILHIQFKDIEVDNLSIALHDLAGKVISKSSSSSSRWSADLSNLTDGMYILSVTDTKRNKINSYKIIKSN